MLGPTADRFIRSWFLPEGDPVGGKLVGGLAEHNKELIETHRKNQQDATV
jgi:hypothetical protein